MDNLVIGNYTLEFDEETHKYFVDGVETISVTQLIKFKFPKKYARIPKARLQAKAKKGTILHEAIEIYEDFGLERNDLQEFRDYKFLKSRFKWKVFKQEIPVIIKHGGLVVCGRFDQLQIVDGVYGIADIKHTSSLDKDYLGYQLNLYRLGVQQSYGYNIEFLQGIHLNDGKRKYIDIPINEKLVFDLLEEYERNKND